MNRPLRTSLLAAAAVAALGVAGVGVLLATFDANSLKPRIVDAVHKATGRTLTVAGDISLRPSLWPTVEISDASLSNPPGFSRPQMATLKRLRVSMAVLPLLSNEVEIDTLTLVQPDILLERNSAGQANWQFTPPIEPAVANAPAGAPATPRKRLLIGAHTVNLQDGAVGYRDDRTGRSGSLGVASLTATAASPQTPTHVEGTANYNNAPVTFTLDTGDLARLQDPQDTTPWPVKLALEVASAKVTAQGTLARPLQGEGYDIAVKGSVADTAALTPLLPGTKLPSIRDVAFAFTVADGGKGQPAVTALTLRTGPGDLGNGVALGKLDLAAPTMDQPLKLDAAGTLNGAPVIAIGTIGSPQLQPVPVDLALRVADIPVSLKGSLTQAAGGFGEGAAVQGLMVSGPPIAMTGDARVALKPRLGVSATLNADRIDLDALIAAADRLKSASQSASPAAAPAPTEQKTEERRPRSDRIFPDTPLPFGKLRDADADLRLAIATLRSGGLDYRKIDTHVVLANGKLTVDPLSGDLPQGHMDGFISVDASQPNPPVHIRLHAPGLALRPVLEMLRQPPIASGNLEVYADLSGDGASPRAIASTLTGALGLAIPGGTIDNRLLGSILGQMLSQINALDLVGRGGSSELRCFGTRLEIHQGVAAIRVLDLSSGLATMTGTGSINLGAETLNLLLRPEARIGGTTIVIPVRLEGPIRKPSARVNEVKSVEDNAATVAGAMIGNAPSLGAIGSLLGAGRFVGGGDMCPAALALARGQAAPAEAPPKGPIPGLPTPNLPIPGLQDPGKTLRNLLR